MLKDKIVLEVEATRLSDSMNVGDPIDSGRPPSEFRYKVSKESHLWVLILEEKLLA